MYYSSACCNYKQQILPKFLFLHFIKLKFLFSFLCWCGELYSFSALSTFWIIGMRSSLSQKLTFLLSTLFSVFLFVQKVCMCVLKDVYSNIFYLCTCVIFGTQIEIGSISHFYFAFYRMCKIVIFSQKRVRPHLRCWPESLFP